MKRGLRTLLLSTSFLISILFCEKVLFAMHLDQTDSQTASSLKLIKFQKQSIEKQKTLIEPHLLQIERKFDELTTTPEKKSLISTPVEFSWENQLKDVILSEIVTPLWAAIRI